MCVCVCVCVCACNNYNVANAACDAHLRSFSWNIALTLLSICWQSEHHQIHGYGRTLVTLHSACNALPIKIPFEPLVIYISLASIFGVEMGSCTPFGIETVLNITYSDYPCMFTCFLNECLALVNNSNHPQTGQIISPGVDNYEIEIFLPQPSKF